MQKYNYSAKPPNIFLELCRFTYFSDELVNTQVERAIGDDA